MSHCKRKTFSCGSKGDAACFCECERCVKTRELDRITAPKVEALRAERDRVIEDVLKDWERLKKFENNMRAIASGRDLLGEIDLLNEAKTAWERIAIEAQTKTSTKKMPL